MTRVALDAVIRHRSGPVIPDLEVEVTDAVTGLPASVYTAETGGSVIPTLTTNDDGRPIGYVKPGSYTVSAVVGGLAVDIPFEAVTNRTLPYINVKEYGAVGDGVANDTAALAAAFAAGDGIYIPDGTYKTDPLVVENDGLHVLGTGKLLNRDTTGQNFIMVRCDDVTIEGIEIDGNEPIQATQTGSALTVGGGTAGEKANRFTLRDATVRSAGFGSVVLWDVDGFNIEGNDLYATYDDALDFLEGARHGAAIGNTVHVNGAAIGISADTNASVPPYDISVVGNTVILNGAASYVGYQWAIMLLECLDMTIAGNTIDCSAGTPNGGIRCVSSTANPRRFSLIGNVIRGGAGCTDGGISLDAHFASDRDMRAQLIGNVIMGFSGSGIAGIRDYGGSSLGIRGNVMSDCYYGIQAEVGTSVNISALSIEGNNVTTATQAIRLASTGSGTGAARVRGNDAAITIDSGWSVEQVGFFSMAAARASNSSAFIDSADGKLKFKDSGGTANALY